MANTFRTEGCVYGLGNAAICQGQGPGGNSGRRNFGSSNSIFSKPREGQGFKGVINQIPYSPCASLEKVSFLVGAKLFLKKGTWGLLGVG